MVETEESGERTEESRERTEEGHMEICSGTLSANVCTARVCTAKRGFRPVPEGVLQRCVGCRAGPCHRCGFMSRRGHG